MPTLPARLQRALFAALALACLSACDDAPDVLDAGPPDADGLDAEIGDAPPPAPDALPLDEAPPATPCVWPADCPEGDCIDGVCAPMVSDRCSGDATCPEDEQCGGFERRFYCLLPCEADRSCPWRPRLCANRQGCLPNANCKDGRCINDCVLDSDCPAGGHCVEGECRPLPALFPGDPIGPLAGPGQLVAGVGVAALDYPIGVSMAGYGARSGASTPYNAALGGSDRVFDHQDGRALVLSTEDDILIVLRLPLGWSTDYLRTLIALEVQARTHSPAHPAGLNVLDKLITVATHSHSGPGRFWNLLAGTGLGVFGHGEFSSEMVHRYAESFATAIVQALEDVQPARFGYTVIDDFDPERIVHSDRRSESPPLLDDRLMVWRVEDLGGRPLMGAISFALHGTHMQETWVTGDVAGGIEQVASDRLSAEAGRFVPVMFLNGNAGNVSPRGDRATDVSWGKIQTLGHLVWPIFRDAWQRATPRDHIALEVVSRRIPITYDRLGYDRSVPDFRSAEGTPYEYGGFSCVAGSREADNPHQDGMLGCRIDLQSFLGHPVMQGHKTAIAALRIDDLVVTTLPGEPTSELGLLLANGVEQDAAAAGMPQVRALNFGYAQDHQLYLLTREDWFLGGYEASQNWFGWALGEYIAAESRALAGQLFTPGREDNATGIQPTWFPDLADDTVDPTPTVETPGRFAVDAPGHLTRGALLEVQWHGGHPGIDLPWVVLERLNDRGGFSPVYRSPGVIFDHKGFEAVTLYRGNYGQDHRWSSRWELPFDFPLGTYRLRAVGQALIDARSRTYEARSAPFELRPATLAIHDWQIEAGTVSLTFTLPDGPTNDDGRSPFDGLEARGHLLRVDPFWRLDGAQRRWSFVLGQPVADPEVTVTVAGGGGPYRVEARSATVDRALVTGRADDGTERVTTVPDWPAHAVDIDLPGPGGYTLFVDDAWGNRARLTISPDQNR